MSNSRSLFYRAWGEPDRDRRFNEIELQPHRLPLTPLNFDAGHIVESATIKIMRSQKKSHTTP